ncbi:MAG: FecR domain-containing protein [Bacteroidota bacterium]
MKDFDQYSELIAKFLAGESSLDEKEALFAWTKEDQANHAFFEELEQVWHMTKGAESSPFEADLDDAWNRIEQSTVPSTQTAVLNDRPHPDLQPSAKVIPLSRKIMRWSIAAAIFFAAGFGLWWTMQAPAEPVLVQVQTSDNEKKVFVLPDQTKVWLNENSTLAYFEDFTKRNVELEGEAFFDVERMEESPFKISSGEAVTTVLGTSFNVRAYPKEERIEVTVEEGRVELAVAEETAKRVELSEGTSGVVYKAEKKVEQVDEALNNAAAWKTAKLDFDDVLMRDVILTLERYFGTEIKVSNEMIYECYFSSPFDQPELEDILGIAGATIGFKFEKEGDAYLLVGDGCQPSN